MPKSIFFPLRQGNKELGNPNTGSPDWLSYYANAVTDMSERAAMISALSKRPSSTDGQIALL